VTDVRRVERPAEEPDPLHGTAASMSAEARIM
jgi:hypothetical protein